MALDQASKKSLTDLGIDVDALTTAITATGEQAYKMVPKTGEIKIGDSTYHVYDTAGHDGLKGRVKTEVLTQATELGVKAVAAAFDVDYKGNDPVKLKAAVEAKLNIPVDEKVKEKDKDIATMTKNWNDEKAKREGIEARLKDREETDRDISYFPEDAIKSVKAKTLRMELKEEGITYGEHEGKPAVFVNGEVQKNPDLTLVDPKKFTAEKFKTKGWIAEPATPPTPGKKTFDINGKPGEQTAKFDAKSAHEQAFKASGGKYDEKYQAVYTEAQLAASGSNIPPAARA